MLARAHLRKIPPLPEAERQAFERCVAELSAIGRNLNQVARRANQDGVVSSSSPNGPGPVPQDLHVGGRALQGHAEDKQAELGGGV